MIISQAPAAEQDSQGQIAALVRQLHETQQRLLELAGGEVDAVIHPGGHSYLLHDAQQNLQRSEAAHRISALTQSSILNALPACIALVDHTGVIRSINEGWRDDLAQYGSLGDSYCGVGENYLEACERARGYSANDAHKAAEGMRSVMSGAARVFSLEYASHMPSGQRWFRLMVSPIEARGPGGAVVMHVDITERRRMETRFRRLVDSNVQGVIFFNTMGEITDGNMAFLSLVGYTLNDLEARRLNWAAMTPPEYAQLDQHALAQLAATGVCAPYEKEWISQQGTRVPILLGAAMFEDNPNEGVCFVLDLTERKKIERQFLRAQRMESIGTLAGGIAHDLNNVLAPIMMSIDVLKLGNLNPQTEMILGTIESSARRGADMVQQILTFARGVEGQRVPIDARHIIAEIQRLVYDTFPKNIRFHADVPANLPGFLGDHTQVHQVLLNLCVNARDAMPNGGQLTIAARSIEVDKHYATTHPDARPGPYLMIQVADTGTGIPRDVIDKIFDPFFTTKELGKGTGLGLSTTATIVKSHGGYLNVYSEPGTGTTFTAYFPIHLETRVMPEALVPEHCPRGAGELILLVDDEAAVRTITQQTLEAFGYRVITAVDGAEAIALYAEHQHLVAAVLTDMMMPFMSGPATVRALRRMNPAVKIIAASGLNAGAQPTGTESMDVNQFLTKPYNAQTVLKALRQVLDEPLTPGG